MATAPTADGRTDDVGAGVTQHQPFMEIVEQQTECRAHDHGSGNERCGNDREDGKQHEGDRARLDRPARGTVKQVPQVGGERDEGGVGEEGTERRVRQR